MNRILREVSLVVSLGCLPITCLAGTLYVAHNRAGSPSGGGMYRCSGKVENCIV